ncbi:MAG: DUF1080 domain-containing protein [Verrucomicrobia bacterium]|nr:DUF1080 domain-containing protein [Verrucomicrobiota bacterium]
MKARLASSFLSLLSLFAAVATAAEPRAPIKTWTDPAAAQREDPDFGIQGEYASIGVGMQLVALGGGKFDGYLLEGGLPGAGWEPGKLRRLLKGGREGTSITLKDESGAHTCVIVNSQAVLTEKGGATRTMDRVERRSPTLGDKVREGARVLFDGSQVDEWNNGKMENGHLLATDCITKRRFGSYKLHLEFRTPYMPGARGQARGNSGVYHSGRWETQILDSFGLEGLDNECGGIYSVSKPRLNMCLPPLSWQTYDVEFTAARFDASGKRTSWPRITVRLNGVLVHDNLELAKDFTTAAPLSSGLTSPEGPVFLQNHGNPVVFRNIWILPRE